MTSLPRHHSARVIVFQQALNLCSLTNGFNNDWLYSCRYEPHAMLIIARDAFHLSMQVDLSWTFLSFLEENMCSSEGARVHINNTGLARARMHRTCARRQTLQYHRLVGQIFPLSETSGTVGIMREETKREETRHGV